MLLIFHDIFDFSMRFFQSLIQFLYAGFVQSFCLITDVIIVHIVWLEFSNKNFKMSF